MQSMTQTAPKYSPLTLRILTGVTLMSSLIGIVLYAPIWVLGAVLLLTLAIASFEYFKLYPSHNAPKSLKLKVEILSHIALGFLYLGISFFFIFKLLAIANFQFYFFTCVAATALGDTFAYFGGRAFGKRKLAPQISPNKTWEGAYVALLGGAMGSIVLHQIYQQPVAIWQQALLGVVLAVIGIYGDLAESALKRAFGVKDSGHILPGHGGVLDRIDAYLFTLPAIYFYAQWIAK